MPPSAPLDAVDLAAADPEGSLAAVEASPQQWRHAVELVGRLDVDVTNPRSVLVAGMGGSGIAGDLASLAADLGGGAPVMPVKGYSLPSWAGPQDAIIAVSYSGNTEETLGVLAAAEQRGVQVAGAVTSGGHLADAVPGSRTVLVPPGRQPRASLAYLGVPVLVMLSHMGVIRSLDAELSAVPGHLERLLTTWRIDSPTNDNPVKQAAMELAELVPVFTGGDGVGGLLALRAKCQVNENANRPSFCNVLPESNHNEVVGWEQLRDTSRRFGLVELRTPGDHPQVTKRFDVTRELTGTAFATVTSFTAPGATWVEQLAAGVLWVDLLSIHLALLSGVDPTPVRTIQELKARIA
ncbi:MAG: bifunctional phosphoglucose/phosphomannose isomerase [Nitriliruptorales bacterium]|nr:bifunctional phosphoglucose/phosphomannose isomerase [Nitriliruptorales bacterium]